MSNETNTNNEVNHIIIRDPGKALRPQHKQTKLTRKQKIAFLELMGKEYNISGNAAKLGLHRNAINYLINHDPQFKEAMDDIKNGWLDKSEGSGLIVAVQPSREGYNDRKLFLTAHRPETYAKGPEIQINQQINVGGDLEIKQLLDKIAPKSSK